MKRLRDLLKRLYNNTTVRYTFWGGVVKFGDILTFQALYYFGLDYRIANFISVILGKLLSYVTNKVFVFKTKALSKKELINEIFRFAFSRGITLLIDMAVLIALTDIFDINPSIGKLITSVVVFICNFLLSKYLVYRTKKKDKEERD